MLALAKRLPEQEKITRAGRWDLQAAALGSEIQGRTLGIVGLGNSGRELVRLVAPFEMRVLAYSPNADPAQAAELGVVLKSLEQVMRQADFVSLHVRLSEQTRRMIGAREFSWMKPSAYFINVARGELVDQAALVEALEQRQIAGAALDVFQMEPLPLSDPLQGLDNVILTPHWSASTREVWQATGEAMLEGMLRMFWADLVSRQSWLGLHDENPWFFHSSDFGRSTGNRRADDVNDPDEQKRECTRVWLKLLGQKAP
jgi:phosphoglycerate dehydrogenase-like enzyme